MTSIILKKEDSGSRIDKVLQKYFKAPKILTHKLIRTKKININGKKVANLTDKVFEGDEVKVYYKFDDEVSKKIADGAVVPKNIVELVKNSIIFENEDMMAINKPYGLATQSGGSLKYSLDDVIRKMNPNLKIVHRLDKETSGLIIVAKTTLFAQKISTLFKEREVEKTYLAVVSPIPKKKSGVIKSYIGDSSFFKGAYKKESNNVKKSETDKEAVTEYKILKVDEEKNIALVEFLPKTGRTHQLRIHSLKIGSPIVGDFRYEADLSLGRKLQLFAYKIKLPKDILSQEEIINAKVPDFFLLKP